VLLGIGWNFMFVGATNLLGEAHSAEERVRAQTANDFIVFGTVACTALGSAPCMRDLAGRCSTSPCCRRCWPRWF
jgi:hypothetical protein